MRVATEEIGLWVCWALAALCVAVVPSAAQEIEGLSITVHDGAERQVREEGYTTFIMDVENTSGRDIDLTIVRAVNDLPGDDWYSSVCTSEKCYGEEVDRLDPYRIYSGGTGGVQVHLQAGKQGSARVLLRMEDGDMWLEQELRVEVADLPEPQFYIVADESERTAEPGDTVDFFILSANLAPHASTMTMRRIETDFPDGSWSSFLCVENDCFPPGTSAPPSVEVDNGKSAVFHLKIVVGNEPGDIGEVELQFLSSENNVPIFQRFSVTVQGTSGVEAKKEGTAEVRVYPNPARDAVVLALPADLNTGNPGGLQVFDARGRIVGIRQPEVVAQGPAGTRLQLDLAGLEPGRYFFIVSGGKTGRKGSLLIVR